MEAHRRFADEGRLLANLRDPHLVRVIGKVHVALPARTCGCCHKSTQACSTVVDLARA